MNSTGIIANSFPKSGTHILTELLSQLGYKQANTHLSRSLLVYGPRNIFRNFRIYCRNENALGKGLGIDIENLEKSVKEQWFKTHLQKHLSEGLFCQAHLPYSKKLDEIIQESGHKMLYIHRHPLDVLVSLKNYILNKKNHPNHTMLQKYSDDTERFLLLIHGFSGNRNSNRMAPFFKKFQNSIEWTKSKGTCSLSFESIIGNKGGGSDEKQRKSILKAIKYLNHDPRELDRVQTKVYNTKSATFHKGTIGQWQTEITSDVLKVCKLKMIEANINIDDHLGLT